MYDSDEEPIFKITLHEGPTVTAAGGTSSYSPPTAASAGRPITAGSDAVPPERRDSVKGGLSVGGVSSTTATAFVVEEASPMGRWALKVMLVRLELECSECCYG